MRKRQYRKLLKQACAKREVLHKNSLPRIFLRKHYYRKNDNPVLTPAEKRIYAAWEEYCTQNVEEFLREIEENKIKEHDTPHNG